MSNELIRQIIPIIKPGLKLLNYEYSILLSIQEHFEVYELKRRNSFTQLILFSPRQNGERKF